MGNMQYFNKPPLKAYPDGGGSKQTPPHQDGYYFMITPQSAVTMWMALEKADEENGCLRYIKGSVERGVMRPHDFSGIVGFSQTITDFDKYGADGKDEMKMVAEPGDL